MNHDFCLLFADLNMGVLNNNLTIFIVKLVSEWVCVSLSVSDRG